MSELGEKLRDLAGLAGVRQTVLAGEDGLLIEAVGDDLDGADVVAALAPPALSAADSFGNASGVGDARTVVSECREGVVVVRELGVDVLLAVVADDSADLARLLHETRAAAETLRPLVE